MKAVLKSSDLKGLSRSEKTRAFTRVLNSTPVVDSKKRVKTLQREIAEFEQRYKMDTLDMLNRLCAGKLANTKDFLSWQKKYMVLCAHKENVHPPTST